jgi:hypothetical protein
VSLQQNVTYDWQVDSAAAPVVGLNLPASQLIEGVDKGETNKGGETLVSLGEIHVAKL